MNNKKNVKNYLVLGGTSGVGFSVASELADDSIVYVIGRNPKKLDEIKSKKIKFLKYEVHDLDDAIKFLQKNIEVKFDGVFISLGQENFKRLGLIENNDIQSTFMPPIVALLAVLNLSAKGKFLNPNSSIVVMSSVSAVRGKSAMSLYGASRAAIESIVMHASNELAKRNIRVNAIRSGAFEGEMHDRITSGMNEDQIREYQKPHLLGFGKTDDIKNLVIFMLSEKGSWFTGSTITIDGGFLAR